MIKKIKVWRSFFQISIIAIIFFFLARAFFRSFTELTQYQWTLNYRYLVLAIIFYLPGFLLEPFIWKRILHFLAAPLSYKEALEICSFSDLAKYIPGGIFPFLGRIYLARGKYVSRNIVVTSLILELILKILSGTIIFLFSISFISSDIYMVSMRRFIWPLFLIPVLIILLCPTLLQRIIKFCSKIFNVDNFPVDISLLNIGETFLFFLVYWFITGAALFFLIRALLPISLNSLLAAVGIFAMSWIVGFLSFLTPSGLGVREGTLSFFLSFYMSLPIAIVIALLSRICLILIEVARVSIVGILKRFF